MALKLARAMGADVTLFTRSLDKVEDATRLGAHHVVLSTDSVLEMNTLRRDGTLVLLGGNVEPHEVPPAMAFIFSRKRLAGSLIGGIPETQEMLDFCGTHGITSDIELIPAKDINTAYERMLKSDVKYRFVIDIATIGD